MFRWQPAGHGASFCGSVLLCLLICEKTSTNKQKNVHILTHLSDSYVSALLLSFIKLLHDAKRKRWIFI